MADDDLDWASGAVDEPTKAIVVVEPPDETAPLVSGVRAGITRQEGLRKTEDHVLSQAMTVVGGAIDFAELDPKNIEAIPEGWVEEYGEKAAKKRVRMAQAGLMPAKEAPVGIKLAAQMVTGIIKARSTEGKAQTFNIGIQVFQGQRASYAEKEVFDEEK